MNYLSSLPYAGTVIGGATLCRSFIHRARCVTPHSPLVPPQHYSARRQSPTLCDLRWVVLVVPCLWLCVVVCGCPEVGVLRKAYVARLVPG
eukprot:7251485-Prymnesium_polylepis.1